MLPIAILQLVSGVASAQEVGAIIRPEVMVDAADDRPGEDHTETHTRIRAFARDDTKLGDLDGTWFLEVRGEHHMLVGDDTEGWFEGSVGESGWEGELGGPVRLRVGNLVERWGKLDYLPVADVLNPRDLTVGPLMPQELQRLPIPMATVSVGSDTFRSETTYIPFARGDKMWQRGTDWSYMRNGLAEDMTGRIATWEGETAPLLSPIFDQIGGSAGSLDPSQRRALDRAIAENGRPQDLLILNGEVAQRLEYLGNNFDLAVMGAYIHNRQPATALDPYLATLLRERRLPTFDEAIADDSTTTTTTATDAASGSALGNAIAGGPLKPSWPRTGVVAAEGSGVVGPLSVRGEAAYWTGRTVRQWYGQATTTPVFAAGVGAVFLRGSAIQISGEARYERLLEVPDELLFVAPEDLMLAGGGRFAFAQDRFSLQVGGQYSIAFAEWAVIPKFGWRASDALRLELGGLILDSPWNAPPGMPRALIYEGGTVGYFSQNDSVTFALTWVL